MPWKADYKVDAVELRFTGMVRGAEIADAKAQVLQHRYEPALRYKLVDFSDVDEMDVRTEDLIRIFDIDKEYLRTHPSYRAVVIAPGRVAYDLSKLWQVLARNVPVHSCVATSREEAMNWLRSEGLAQ